VTASLSGFVVALPFLVLSVLPIVAVGISFAYSLKLAATILLENLLAVAIYLRRRA